MASLNATLLRNRIIGGLRASPDQTAQQAALHVSQNFIFDYPRLDQMSQAIAKLVNPSFSDVAEKHRTQHIVEFIEKYSANLPARPRGHAQRAPEALTVFITGSTGNLGSHIVASLLGNERVAKVFTFDRSNPGTPPLRRLESAFKDRGLPLPLLSNGKLSALTGDLDAPRFGLEESTFQEVRHPVLTH